MSKLYFLTVNYNSSSLIERLIKSLGNSDEDKYQIVIVNNSLKDRDIFNLKTPRIKIIDAQENLGFGRACNLGLQWINNQNSNAIVWLINPDTYFDVRFDNIATAIEFFEKNSTISILGTTVLDSQGNITSAGGTFTPGTAALSVIDSFPQDQPEVYLKTDWVSGCSLLINLANFNQLPQFDLRYFLYYEDLDFCLHYGQQGHRIAVTKLLKVFHDTSSISDRNLFKKYQHVTKSYLIHIEKHGNLPTFILTNIRLLLNTIRLLVFKPQQGLGKLIGIYSYWQSRLTN